MPTLVEDIRTAADWIAKALSSSGYRADFSITSLKEVDRFFDEHSKNGQAVSGGLLSEQLGSRMFALGGYVGEVIRRTHGGHWQANDKDPEGEINIALVLPTGGLIWPVQRVMKRFKNGAEDDIYAYGMAMASDPAHERTGMAQPKSSKPWWKFW
jgi:hypothetical protein